MTPKNPPAIVKPAPITRITIGGHTYPALLCDTPATRHRGLAGTPNGSTRCCIMVWHHKLKHPRVIGAINLHQTYYILQMMNTTTTSGDPTPNPAAILQPHATCVFPMNQEAFYNNGRHPTMIEVPAQTVRRHPDLFYHPPIVWKIPAKDAEIPPRKPPKQPKPNDPQ